MGENSSRKTCRGLAETERTGEIAGHVAALAIRQAEMNMAAIANMIGRRLGREAGTQGMPARRFARDLA